LRKDGTVVHMMPHQLRPALGIRHLHQVRTRSTDLVFRPAGQLQLKGDKLKGDRFIYQTLTSLENKSVPFFLQN
jgi:hypothetical protein